MLLSTINVISAFNSTNTQVYDVLNRIYLLVGSVSAIIIALLWVPIALGFFSSDENRKTSAKMKLNNAIIGTLIYVLAMSGAMYAIFTYVVNGT